MKKLVIDTLSECISNIDFILKGDVLDKQLLVCINNTLDALVNYIECMDKIKGREL